MPSLKLDNYRSFGEYVRSYRIFLGISQIAMAKDLNISRQTLANIEHGKSNPQLENFLPILKYMRNKGAPQIDFSLLQ